MSETTERTYSLAKVAKDALEARVRELEAQLTAALQENERLKQQLEICARESAHDLGQIRDLSAQLASGAEELKQEREKAQDAAVAAFTVGQSNGEALQALESTLPVTRHLLEIACKIQKALGDGADEEAWRPGEYWADAAVRAIHERALVSAELKAEKERARWTGTALDDKFKQVAWLRAGLGKIASCACAYPGDTECRPARPTHHWCMPCIARAALSSSPSAPRLGHSIHCPAQSDEPCLCNLNKSWEQQ